MTLHKVFVYGTLKSGEPNHQKLIEDTGSYRKLICLAKTSTKYPLIIASQYNIPFMLYEPGMGNNVEGELYEVDDKVLKALDELEDHPNFYIREQNEVISLEDSTVHTAWIYFIKSFRKELLEKQMLKNYSNNGSFPKYVTRYLRLGVNFKKDEILCTTQSFVSSEEAGPDDLNNLES
ncbi:hypothetical protein WA026_001795 [Henosepilachna vigintioctopunctata]|uniref:Gamma-glutamylcyclotransferase family protein n=1 Tax=Henosepilachna vigintioctopunctata TaxID=420089 RepID=A0AAW1UUF5_9CUCU